jgi:photosystem II stability/assembly factor-like uncharacterized protein
MDPRPRARRIAALLALIVALPLAAERRRAAVPEIPAVSTQWTAPQCATVTGLPSLRFTLDMGDSVAANDRSPSLNTRPHDLIVTDVPNVLYAALEDAIYESRDAGCSWAKRLAVPGLGYSSVGMTTSRGGRVFVWNNTDPFMARIRPEGDDVVVLPDRVAAIAANPVDPDHLVAVGALASIYESTDGGETWTSGVRATNGVVGAVAFNPRDFNHILISVSSRQIAESRDGGKTWAVRATPDGANVWSVAFSPADSRVVWMQGLRPGGSETIYRSTDGGATFSVVLTASAEIPFNRRRLAPHPEDRDLVAFGSWNNLIVLNGQTRATRIGAFRFAWDLAVWSRYPGTLYLLGPDIVALP